MKVPHAVLLTLIVLDPGARSQQPIFKGGVDLVTLSVVVHNRNGRPVTGLSHADFELFDAGERQPIVAFRSEPMPVSIALLFDVSGSMDVGPKVAVGREAVRHIVSWLESGRDQLALFTFDTQLKELQPFTTIGADVLPLLDALESFGATSLYDSIGAAGLQLEARAGPRRALVVVTDGADNRSQASPGQVSDVASRLDVPVYVLIVSPFDHPVTETAADPEGTETRVGPLDALARATGGALFMVSAPAHASVAARQIVDELRHQYLIAFEPSVRAGWHPLAVRTRDTRFIVRARSGYVAGPRTSQSH